MPDAFGFETPQEAQARVRDRFLQASQQVSALGMNATPGQRVGASLANIFGGKVQQFIDTRAARKQREKELIAEFGISPEQAKARAREEIEPEFAEVRQAKALQSASGESQDLVFQLAQSGVPRERAQAIGMLSMAQRLRAMGMGTEATNLSLQASELLTQAEERLDKMASVKASTAKTLAETEQVGVSPFQEQLNNREALIAQKDVETDPVKLESLERQIGALDAKILKDTALTGTTEFDLLRLGQDPAFARTQMGHVVDETILNQQLDLAKEFIEGTTTFDQSWLARAGAGTIGFMQSTFGVDPSENLKEFETRVKNTNAGMTYVSAQIRHALTGAAMSAQEAVLLTPFLPVVNDSKTTKLAKIEAIREFASLAPEIRKAILADPETMAKFMGKQITLMEKSVGARAPAGTTVTMPGGGQAIIGTPRRVEE